MTFRNRLFVFFIWWSVIGFSIWLGGTIFSMSVIVPMWSESPPESVRKFFGETTFMKYIFNFFGPPWMALRNLPVIVTLILAWQMKPHRNYLLITTTCLLIGIAYTLFYIYPINDELMSKAGGSRGGVEVQKMVDAWISADRIRLVIMTIGYFFLLKTFRLPTPPGNEML